jgi:uncharacterized membrane protein YhdT
MDQQGRLQPDPSEPYSGRSLAGRVKEQFPAVFITLVSVLVGLVFQDLVEAAHSRMQLWPLTADSVRTWCQLFANGATAMTVWIVFSHIGIMRRHMPTFGDSLVTIVPPVLILAATTFVGRADIWPWFYMASLYLASAILAVHWTVHLAAAEPGLASLSTLARFNGVLLIPYLGVPTYALLGWADQHHMLPTWFEVTCAVVSAPMSFLACLIFFRDWRRAIAVVDSARP